MNYSIHSINIHQSSKNIIYKGPDEEYEEEEMLRQAIAMSLEEHPRVEKEEESEEEMLARAFALSLE